MYELKKHYSLESSRRLPLLDANHPCSNWHGHSFQVTVIVHGELNEMGWVMDYSAIDEACQPILAQLDHCQLNDHIENPTTEALCKYLYEHIKESLPELSAIEVAETRDCSCRYPTKYTDPA